MPDLWCGRLVRDAWRGRLVSDGRTSGDQKECSQDGPAGLHDDGVCVLPPSAMRGRLWPGGPEAWRCLPGRGIRHKEAGIDCQCRPGAATLRHLASCRPAFLLLTGSLGCTGRPDRPGPGGRGSAMAGRHEVSGRPGGSRFRVTAAVGDAIASSEGDGPGPAPPAVSGRFGGPLSRRLRAPGRRRGRAR